MEARVLIVDADTAAAPRMGRALDSAGRAVTWCSFAPSDVAENLRDFRPTPAEVMALLQVTPMEVAAVVRELLRRGVASPQP